MHSPSPAQIDHENLRLALTAAVISVTHPDISTAPSPLETVQILTIQHPPFTQNISEKFSLPEFLLPELSLPVGPFTPRKHATLDRGVKQWVEEQTGLALRYIEQLYSFGDRYRDIQEMENGSRLVSIGYLALTTASDLYGNKGAKWHDIYALFPWEDWRGGKPDLIEQTIIPHLRQWSANQAGQAPHLDERIHALFGAEWDFERCLERYELLYEAGLVAEALRDHLFSFLMQDKTPSSDIQLLLEKPEHMEMLKITGIPMAMDNRRILATALSRLRGKMKYRPVLFDILPESFTLLQLQKLVESFAGVTLHKQNFRRHMMNSGLLEDTGAYNAQPGRPARLYRFYPYRWMQKPGLVLGLPMK